MIKLLIVVFSFFLIVSEGHADTVTYGSDGLSNGTVDSNGKVTSTEGGGSSAAETKARQNDSGLYANKKASSDQLDSETTKSINDTAAQGAQEIAKQAAEGAKNMGDDISKDIDAENAAEEIVITAERRECDTKPELCNTNNILGLETRDLRSGNVNQDTISKIIVNIINVLLGVAGTVAIFSLIYHAVQMQINSGITGDSSGVDKAKKGMIGSLIGFVIAISAWFLVTRVVELLGAAS